VSGTGGTAGASGAGGGTGGGTGTGGAAGAALVFTQLGPTGGFNEVRCGADACYITGVGDSSNYRYVYRLAHGGAELENVSAGLGGTGVTGLLIVGRDDLYLAQGNTGVLMRAAGAASFVGVGDPLTIVRSGPARGSSGALYVGTSLGVYALPQGGTAFAAIGTGLAGATRVAIQGTDLFAAYDSVRVLPGLTGAWVAAGTGSPTAVADVTFDRAGNLYATSADVETRAGVYRLGTDRGAWQDVTAPLRRYVFNQGVFTNIVFDVRNDGYIVLKRDGLTGSNIVARRPSTGTQWETIDSYGLPGGVVFCLGLGMDGSGRFVVATTSGVYRSTPCPTCI
jgi:hypothetical protein